MPLLGRKRIRKLRIRKLICFVVAMSYLLLPSNEIIHPVRVLASSAIDLYADKTTAPYLNLLSFLLENLFGPPTPAQTDTLNKRLLQVARIRISPSRYVAYEGQSHTFSAIGQNLAGQTVQGATFAWESSDPSKLQIDDAGQATFLSSGLTSIVCRAGKATAITQVLVKPGSRPRQTDAEWRADQETLPESVSGSADGALPALLDKLMPTAYAQGGGYTGNDFGYDELWSEPRNLLGSPRNRAVEPSTLGPVLPEGSNFTFAMPLISLGGRGLSASLTLQYNSRVWSRHGNAVTFSAVGGFPFAGFSLGFGRILTYGSQYLLIDPDGTLHYLSPASGGIYQTTDGTHITLVVASGSTKVYYSDGTKVTYTFYNSRWLPSQIADSNGNYIQVSYKYGVASPLAIDFVTDTEGRKIQFNYNASGYLISITAPGYGGTAQNPVTRTVAQFDYQSRTLSYNFSGLTVENTPTGAFNVLRHVYFPATGTGSLFTYSDYGMIYNVSSRLQMTIDGNGVISDGVENASVAFNYPTLGTTPLTDAPSFTQRTESTSGSPTGTYNYSTWTDPVAQTMSFVVNRPDGSQYDMVRDTNATHLSNGLLLQSGIHYAAASVFTYANDPGGSIQVQSLTSYNNLGQTTYTTYDYDQYGNVTNQRDYGFQIGGSWQVRRRTNYTYLTDTNYTSRYLRSLATEVKTYDALENTNDADDVLIAKTAFIYDNYAATGGMEGYTGMPKPPGHDAAAYTTSFTYRGNVTGLTEWIDIAANTTLPTRLKKYDVFGNVLQEQLSCCKEKVFTYVQDDYWAKPPAVTDGDPAGLHLTGSTTYDFNTGLPKYTEFANLGKRWFYYDAALRVTRHELPNGTVETISYNDATMTVSSTKTGMGTTTVVYNRWGRAVQQVTPGNGQVNISYDAMGRVASQTNPFTAGGQPGPSTTYQYDALGRVAVVTSPDNQTIQNSYSGNTVVVIDQVNRKIKRETDGLGRLVKVTEQDAAGTLAQETTYSYNLLGKLIEVNQGNQLRSFKYDALGRLLYERMPEQAATISDGTGAYWSTKYTYTDFHAVSTKTDARGVITTYTYDQLNRLLGYGYNTTGAPGVAVTQGVAYSYNNNNSSPTRGMLLSAGAGDYLETYSYDSYKRASSVTRTIEGNNYMTGYMYGVGSLRSQITYPSNRVVNINRDSIGRLSSLTDQSSTNYLSGIGYNATGQVIGLTLGSGISETYSYDTNRLQLATQTATKSGGPQNGLMNVSYGYQASAGQNGAGTTAGNAGQLMTISGTINQTTESASYTYDLQARLATYNQTSNGASAQRRFGYDRFGNRTAVWNAVSGGSNIQSVLLQPPFMTTNNRILSVTDGGGTKSYSYDATGNVTNDGAHSYTYDAENRLVSVDAGATAQYSYDHLNRRVKKVTGATNIRYVWEGGQLIAEYNANTGSLIAEYIYFDSRMIAKVEGGVTNYLLTDRLSARLTLDADGNVLGRQAHMPFGEDFAASGTQDKRHFTSYERDEGAGLDYAMNRMYSSGVGRFMQADPYRASGYIADPQSWNRYRYSRNDPVNLIDPFGLQEDPPKMNCNNCTVNVNAGGGTISPISSGILGPGVTVLPPTGPMTSGLTGGSTSGPQNTYENLKNKWKELNPCEVKVSAERLPAVHAVDKARNKAFDVATSLPGFQGGDWDGTWYNAVLHCVWNCLMTVKLDFAAAKAFGDAHECDKEGNPQTSSSDPNVVANTKMDLNNNDVGRTIGYNYPSQSECITRCKFSNDIKWIKGSRPKL